MAYSDSNNPMSFMNEQPVCEHCNTLIPGSTLNCPSCGYPQGGTEEQKSEFVAQQDKAESKGMKNTFIWGIVVLISLMVLVAVLFLIDVF